MAYEKLARLAAKLHNKTISSAVSWEETAQEDVYQANFGDYTVQVLLKPGQDDVEDVKLVILNEMGQEIESFTDEDIRPWDFGDKSSYYIMREIFDTARRMALGTEQAVDSILSILEKDDDIPF